VISCMEQVLDGGLVTRRDLANNFFVCPQGLNQPRAKVGAGLVLWLLLVLLVV
jgi:hypothetical protein